MKEVWYLPLLLYFFPATIALIRITPENEMTSTLSALELMTDNINPEVGLWQFFNAATRRKL